MARFPIGFTHKKTFTFGKSQSFLKKDKITSQLSNQRHANVKDFLGNQKINKGNFVHFCLF
ncbi:hypothetical protein PRUPE_7G135100 [Prunus persica]|uniref:Uncharacterized protein n=1 Tax=Prunus persica TaxID=3760 RepID=A0A251NE28_PRUPE|nr:hypothetical protein PRUPE_7G135100 [Prunus persica]